MGAILPVAAVRSVGSVFSTFEYRGNSMGYRESES